MAMPNIQGERFTKEHHTVFYESNMNNNIITIQNIRISKMMVSLKNIN